MNFLFKTTLQQRLFTYVFTHPDDSYYVRELANIIDVSPGNLSRELAKCTSEGLFTYKINGNLKLFTLNKSHPLYAALKEIVYKTFGVEGALRELVAKYEEISLAILHGSFAKQKEKTNSDIDLIIVENSPKNLDQDKFIADIEKLEGKLGREINFISYSKKEFRREKNKEGSFLALVLREKKIILKGRVDEK